MTTAVPRFTMSLRRLLLNVVVSVATFSSMSFAEDAVSPLLGSKVWDWDEHVVKHTNVGARRDVNDGPTATLERFECHITTLNPNLTSHAPHQHPQEEFIILQEGTLDVGINGEIKRVGPGSMFFFAAYDWHNVNNVGEVPATYLVFNLATGTTRGLPRVEAAKSAAPGTLDSGVFEWKEMSVKSTRTGERRDLFDAPTVTCRNLECHITTLNPGQAPHPGHRHPDEELIIVKEGKVEATINGVARSVGGGGIIFFASNDEHALRNVGDTPATYYVIRIVTEKTPAAVAAR